MASCVVEPLNREKVTRKRTTLKVARTVWSRKTLIRVLNIERDSSAPALFDFFPDVDLEALFLDGKADSSKDCLVMILLEML